MDYLWNTQSIELLCLETWMTALLWTNPNKTICVWHDGMCAHAYLPFRSCVKCNRHSGIAIFYFLASFFYIYQALRLSVCINCAEIMCKVTKYLVLVLNKGFKHWQILNFKLRPFHLTFDDKQCESPDLSIHT